MGIIDWLTGKPPPDRYNGAWIAPMIEEHAPGAHPSALSRLLEAAVTLCKAGEDGMSKRLFDREIASYELAALVDRAQLYEQVLAMIRRWIPALRGRELGEIEQVAAYAKLPLDVGPRLAELAAERDAIEQQLVVSETVPRFTELEQAVLDDPDDQGWLVLADWLQQQGDPRGELIALEVKGEEAAADRFLEQHEAALIGPLEPYLDMISWRRGYIHRARLACSTDLETSNARALDALLRHASGRFLTELVLAPDILFGEELQLADVIAVLVEHAPPLRSLFIGDFNLEELDDVGQYIVGDVSALLAALPRLRELKIYSTGIELGAIAHPTLARLEVASTELSPTMLRAIAELDAPNLKRLSLWCFHGFATDPLFPLLARDLALDHLGLFNTIRTDDIVDHLACSPLLRRLRTLHLSPGELTDAGAATMAKHADAFRHLDQLDVSHNRLTDEGRGAIASLCPRVVADYQEA